MPNVPDHLSYDAIRNDDVLYRIYVKMLDYLGRGALSEKRLVKRIVRLRQRYPAYERYREYTSANAWKVMPLLREQGYIDERAYAERTLESLLHKQNGIRLIRKKMLSRDIDQQIIDDVIRSYKAQGTRQNFHRVIAQTRRRYERALEKYHGQRLKKAKARQVVYSWLAMRGFDASDIHSIISQTILTE